MRMSSRIDAVAARVQTAITMKQVMSYYCKRRKFQGIINFVVFADATILRNLILGHWPIHKIPGEPTVDSSILALVLIIMQNVVLTSDRVGSLCRLEILHSA